MSTVKSFLCSRAEHQGSVWSAQCILSVIQCCQSIKKFNWVTCILGGDKIIWHICDVRIKKCLTKWLVVSKRTAVCTPINHKPDLAWILLSLLQWKDTSLQHCNKLPSGSFFKLNLFSIPGEVSQVIVLSQRVFMFPGVNVLTLTYPYVITYMGSKCNRCVIHDD